MEACAIPLLAKAVGWRPIKGGFELTGASGSEITTFHRLGVDDFGSVEGDYLLERSLVA